MQHTHHRRSHNRQQGAVSLFVVIFTALLFVAVTVGFTVLMLSDQQQSTDNDLAQSALDSANAGAEDAKRVLAQYANCIETGSITNTSAPDYATCNNVKRAIETGQCNTVNAALGDTADTKERKVQQTEADDAAEALGQAYTCVKITPDTFTYVGKTRGEGDIRLVPLKTGQVPFDTVKISWLKRDDMDLGNANPNFRPIMPSPETASNPGYLPLPTKAEWRNDRRGAILRVGALSYQPGHVDLNEIDNNARTAFLYSSSVGAVTSATSALDIAAKDQHRPLTNRDGNGLDGALNYPSDVRCDDSPSGYMCSTYIRLARALDPNEVHYLTLASLYRDTSFEVSLLDSRLPCTDTDKSGCVRFRNVQPELDVTGRANNVFRRVVSRVESADASEAPYPRAALGATQDICKNFVVTDDPDDYRDDAQQDAADNGGTCHSIVNP